MGCRHSLVKVLTGNLKTYLKTCGKAACAFEQPLRTDFSGFCSWAEETLFIRYEGGDLFNQHPCSSVGLSSSQR